MLRRFPAFIVIACFATTMLGAQTAPPAGPAPMPCRTNPEMHRLDFWVGNWEVVPTTAPGTVVGHSHVDVIAGGCGLLENWAAMNGGEGKSINAYNPAAGQWQQHWVGQGGGVTDYTESQWHGDTIDYRAYAVDSRGRRNDQRLRFWPEPDRSVRQVGELSSDSGRTWQPGYDFRYRRVP